MENRFTTDTRGVAWSPSLPVSAVQFCDFHFIPGDGFGKGAQPHRLDPSRGVVAALMANGDVRVLVRDTAPCPVATPEEVVKTWLAAASAISPEGMVPDLQGASAAGSSIYGRIAYKAKAVRRQQPSEAPQRLHNPALSGTTADGVQWEAYPVYAWHYERQEGQMEAMCELVVDGLSLFVQDETGRGAMSTATALMRDAIMPPDTTPALYSALSGIADLRTYRDEAALKGNGYDPVPLQRIEMLGRLITERTADGRWTCSRIMHSLVQMLWEDLAKKNRPWTGDVANTRSENWNAVRASLRVLTSRL